MSDLFKKCIKASESLMVSLSDLCDARQGAED